MKPATLTATQSLPKRNKMTTATSNTHPLTRRNAVAKAMAAALIIAALATTAALAPQTALAKSGPAPQTTKLQAANAAPTPGTQPAIGNDACGPTGPGPYIVPDGVRMYEAYGHPGGWKARIFGDDTHGNGELMVVTVEFNEPVIVSEATFKIQIGDVKRTFAPMALQDNIVYFGALVESSNLDTDGIYIGNHTETFGHNPPGAIYSEETGRAANLEHPRIGVLPNHKVDGRHTRAKVTGVWLASAPQTGNEYRSGETIEVAVAVSQNAAVRGIVHAGVRVDTNDGHNIRDAIYSRGSGTNRLRFLYRVQPDDLDQNGVALPDNLLAKQNDLPLGNNGGGHIVGPGGLLVDTASRAKQPDSGHQVDGSIATVPEIMADVRWQWQQDVPDSETLSIDFDVTEDPGHFSETESLVAAIGVTNISGQQVAFGLSTDVDQPDTDGSQGKGVFFTKWGPDDTEQNSAQPSDNGWTQHGANQLVNSEDDATSVVVPYDWGAGEYSLELRHDGAAKTDGRYYGVWITNKATSVETKAGSLFFAAEGGNPQIAARAGLHSRIMFTSSSDETPISSMPTMEVRLSRPDASVTADYDEESPVAINIRYATIHGHLLNSDVVYLPNDDQVKITAGGRTVRITPNRTTRQLTNQ